MKPASLKRLHSAGGVIFRKAENSFEVALIAIKGGTVWTLPKGIIDKGEEPAEAAAREIEEETGLSGEVVGNLGERSYWFYLKNENIKYKKTVTYFLLEYTGGNIDNYCSEVDEAGWYSLDAAIKKVSYKSDREILERAKEKIEP